MARFNAEADMGSLYVGSPETVARKIAKDRQRLSGWAVRHEVFVGNAAA